MRSSTLRRGLPFRLMRKGIALRKGLLLGDTSGVTAYRAVPQDVTALPGCVHGGRQREGRKWGRGRGGGRATRAIPQGVIRYRAVPAGAEATLWDVLAGREATRLYTTLGIREAYHPGLLPSYPPWVHRPAAPSARTPPPMMSRVEGERLWALAWD